jgi:hypothetical protein
VTLPEQISDRLPLVLLNLVTGPATAELLQRIAALQAALAGT